MTRRRSLLLLGGFGGLMATGVLAFVDPFNTPLILITNRTDRDVRVTTMVRSEPDDRIVVNDSMSIGVGQTESYSELIAGEPLIVTLRTGHGLEQRIRWTKTDPENGLSIVINPSSIGYSVATPP